jgi:site-specific DNA-methyltransferase (adenine-specific)
MGRTRLYIGDSLEIVPALGLRWDRTAVITDPPYGGDYNFNGKRFTDGKNGHGPASSRQWKSVIGDNRPFDPAPWLKFSKVILWGYQHHARLLPVGSVLVWLKRKDGAFGSFLSDAELAWQKGGHGVYCFRDTSLYGQTKNRLHPAQKPIGLFRWCIRKARIPKGWTILDPYMGTGAVGVAASLEGYSYVGIELEPNYYKIAVNRLSLEGSSNDLR